MPAAGLAWTVTAGSPLVGRAEVRLRDETARPAPAARGQSSRARATAGYLGLSPHHSPPSPRLLFASPLHHPGLGRAQDFTAGDRFRGAGAEAQRATRGGRRDGEGRAVRARGRGRGLEWGIRGTLQPRPRPLLSSSSEPEEPESMDQTLLLWHHDARPLRGGSGFRGAPRSDRL